MPIGFPPASTTDLIFGSLYQGVQIPDEYMVVNAIDTSQGVINLFATLQGSSSYYASVYALSNDFRTLTLKANTTLSLSGEITRLSARNLNGNSVYFLNSGGWYFSPDGITWNTNLSPPGLTSGLLYDGSGYIACTYNDQSLRYANSLAATSWTAVAGILPTSNTAYGCAQDGSTAVLVAYDATTGVTATKIYSAPVANILNPASWTLQATIPTTYASNYPLVIHQPRGCKIINGYLYIFWSPAALNSGHTSVIGRAPMSDLTSFSFVLAGQARAVTTPTNYADMEYISTRGYLCMDTQGYLYPSSDGANFNMASVNYRQGNEQPSATSVGYELLAPGVGVNNGYFIGVVNTRSGPVIVKI